MFKQGSTPVSHYTFYVQFSVHKIIVLSVVIIVFIARIDIPSNL
jgi:hypothetical protein